MYKEKNMRDHQSDNRFSNPTKPKKENLGEITYRDRVIFNRRKKKNAR